VLRFSAQNDDWGNAMLATPGAMLSAIVTLLAVLEYFYFGMRVGGMRSKHNVLAPATTGHPEFERAFRVHYNTLEAMIVFLPLLWVATIYFHTIGWLPAAFGVLFIVARYMYMLTYMSDPAKRGPATMMGVLAMLGLLVLAVVGLVQSWGAVTAA
jgi:uncharacterized MAPEG superfamily protein